VQLLQLPPAAAASYLPSEQPRSLQTAAAIATVDVGPATAAEPADALCCGDVLLLQLLLLLLLL
jgi:hypothetical protein